MSERRWALATFLVATVGFVVVAAWRIPWHPVPGGTPPPVPAGTVFTAAQIARANAYTDPARHLAWASLAVSLVVTLVLGFTPLGARLVGRLRGWWWVRVLLAVLLLAVIGRLVTLPFAIIGHHRSAGVRAQQRGLGTLGRRPGQGPGAVGGDLRAAPARAHRLCPPLAAGLAGRGRGRCSADW